MSTVSKLDLHVGHALRRFRARRRLSQAALARDLGWPTSKVAKLETAEQGFTLKDVEHVIRTVGVEFLGSPSALADLWRGEADMYPEVTAGKMLEDSFNALVTGEPMKDWSEYYFPSSKIATVMMGARLPRGLISTSKEKCEAALDSSRRKLNSLLGKFKEKESMLEVLRPARVLRVADIGMLARPVAKNWAPLAPRLRYKMRGHVFSRRGPHLVVVPSTQVVTVVTGPKLILHPLKVLRLFKSQAQDADERDELAREREWRTFRLAGFLCSSWAQNWLRSEGRYWFSRAGGFRDVPVPRRLWNEEDTPARMLEEVAREVWAGGARTHTDDGRLLRDAQQRLDALVEPMMSNLVPMTISTHDEPAAGE